MVIVLIGIAFPFVHATTTLFSTTLADQIGTIIDGINFSDVESMIQHEGVIFGTVTNPMYGTGAYDGLPTVVALGRADALDQLDGFSFDPTTYLTSQTMLSYLPNTWTYNNNDYYLIYHRFLEDAYQWAQGTSYASKWNVTGADNDMYNVIQSQQDLSGLPSQQDFGTRIAYDPPSTSYDAYQRYYDSNAETMQFLASIGDLTYSEQIWNYIQSFFWNGAYYGYNGKSGIECEAGPFAIVIGYINALTGNTLPNFNRVPTDLEYKFLNEGWNSPLWGGSQTTYVCTHAGDSARERLENTLAGWGSLFAYYQMFSSTNEQNIYKMLTNTGDGQSAWQHLLSSALYDSTTHKFIMMTHDSQLAGTESDEWTAYGLQLLFLMGIVPVTGTIALPLNDQEYEDCMFPFPATMFHFNYTNQSITIPVQAGTMEFQYGSQVTDPVDFPTKGVYRITFSSDWDTVTSSTKVSDLDSHYQYLSSLTENTIMITAHDQDDNSITGLKVVIQNSSGITVEMGTTPFCFEGDIGSQYYFQVFDPFGIPNHQGEWFMISLGNNTVNFVFTMSGIQERLLNRGNQFLGCCQELYLFNENGDS